MNKTETTEVLSPTAVTGISTPSKFALIAGITILLQVASNTIRNNSDFHNDPNTPERCTSQDNSSGVTSSQLQVPNKILQQWHFLNLIEPKLFYQCTIHLMIILTKCKITKL